MAQLLTGLIVGLVVLAPQAAPSLLLIALLLLAVYLWASTAQSKASDAVQRSQCLQ